MEPDEGSERVIHHPTPASSRIQAAAHPTASVDLQASVASKLANLQSAIRDGTVRFEPVVSQTRALKLASDCPNGYGRMYNDGKCYKGFAQ